MMLTIQYRWAGFALLSCVALVPTARAGLVQLSSSTFPPASLNDNHRGYPIAELSRFPDEHTPYGLGFIDTPSVWESVWEGLGSDLPTPEVDFATHFVAYAHNTDFLNSIRVHVDSSTTDEVISIGAWSTVTGFPLEDIVLWSAIAVPRNAATHVRLINRVLPLRAVPEPNCLALTVGMMGVAMGRWRYRRAIVH